MTPAVIAEPNDSLDLVRIKISGVRFLQSRPESVDSSIPFQSFGLRVPESSIELSEGILKCPATNLLSLSLLSTQEDG
jgi:hypothetical protein